MDTNSFLDAVVSTIKRNVPLQGNEGLTAARLGWLLRSLHGIDWNEFGYPKLSAVLADLQAARLIRVDKNAKGALAVWPAGAEPAAPVEVLVAKAHPSDRHAPFRRLRTSAWNAFVLPLRSDVKHRYLNRQQGQIINAAAESLPDAHQWAEVEPISEELQKEWARDLLTELDLQDDAHLATVLARPDWQNALRDELATRKPVFASRWNRIRSGRVQGHVEAWCERNAVPYDLVFQPYRFPRTGSPTNSLPATTEPSVLSSLALVSDAAGGELRAALMGALSQMTTEELLALPIPPKYLVPALRPDLGRH